MSQPFQEMPRTSAEASAPPAEAGAGPEDEDLEVEVALLTLAEDTGGATEEVDLNALSPTEKRALLACLRQRLGLSSVPESPVRDPQGPT